MGPAAPRFSDQDLQVLVENAQKRRPVINPAGHHNAFTTKKAWIQIVAVVSTAGDHQCSWIQCRKRLNDLRSSEVSNLAHPRRTPGERSHLHAAAKVQDMEHRILNAKAEDKALAMPETSTEHLIPERKIPLHNQLLSLLNSSSNVTVKVVLASSIRSPEESLQIRSKSQMASRRQAMDRTQRKESTDHCERRRVEFEKFDPANTDSKIEALISSAVSPNNNSFFENMSSLYSVPEHRHHVKCESSKAGILKHNNQNEEEINAGLLLAETTCKKYALRKKTMIQYNRENSLEQIEFEKYCKSISIPSASAEGCQDYAAVSRLPLKRTLFNKNLKTKCKGSRKMLVKLTKVNIQKYLMHTERKTKMCQKLLTHNNLSAGVKMHYVTTPEQDTTALPTVKKGRRNKVAALPTGDIPVVIKRKRGRPRKVLPEGSNEATNHVKRKPRHHKLSPPQPTYIAGSNDNTTDYADVLSKLAFLTKQSLILGRCSPPRCWSPSDPGSFQRSASMHQDMSQFYRTLAGTRRRGGKAGCSRGRQVGQFAESSSTFSDFFEGIGKRKRIFLGETKLYARKCKWGTEMKEKPVQRRKPYKRALPFPEHGIFRNMNTESSEWARQNESFWTMNQGYPSKQQIRNGLYPSYPGMSTQSFPNTIWESSSVSRNGYLMGCLSSNQSNVAQQSPGCIAGYFRSLLDSDDSSDLMDLSFSQTGQESCNITGSFGVSNSTQPSRQLTHYQEGFDKTSSPNCAGSQQHANQTRQAYPQMIPDNSDSVDYGSSYHASDTETFQRIAPQPPLSRQAGLSCQHAPDNYAHYSNYRAKAPSFSNSDVIQQPREYSGLDFLGNRDCTFGYDTSNNVTSSQTSSTDTYSQHAIGSNLHFNKVSSFNAFRPDHSPLTLQASLTPESQSDAACSMDHTSQKYFNSLQLSAEPSRMAFSRGLQLSCKSGFNLCDGNMAYFNHHYAPVLDYTLNESKDILDISNYTPQKVKLRSFPETFTESSSHFNTSFENSEGSVNICSNMASEEKSSLSSLEKLMMDWDETVPVERAGPKVGYKRQWNHHVPFPSDSKAVYGRRKRIDMSSPSQLVFPASPPFPSRKATIPRQTRNIRGLCVSNRREQFVRKSKLLQKTQGTNPIFSDSTDCGLDYGYNADSSMPPTLSNAPNFQVQKSDQKEYCSLYSSGCSTPMPDENFSPRFPGNDVQETVPMYSDLKQPTLEVEPFQSPQQQLSTQALQHSINPDHERLLSDNQDFFSLRTPGYVDNLESNEGKKHPAFYDALENSSGTDVAPTTTATSRDLPVSQLQFEPDNPVVLETNNRYLQNSTTYSSLDENKKEAGISLFGMQGRNNLPSAGPQIIPLNIVAQIDKETQKLAIDYSSSAYASATLTTANASPASSDSSIHVDNNYADKQGNRRQAAMGLLLDQNQDEVYTGNASQ
ncbi:AT-hook DNA-binding motif-containing protein 1 [Carcharodon carcharias]|uniref:AT-hook DNA-binding motif-containing protein 1 n=1 Tax=Carcharodon carcharias TaxID=13397 RepID=UPI001B7DA9DF|nr:AT-hook DNA-binding motif-containing protein 1 [Carcharodon carcharias]